MVIAASVIALLALVLAPILLIRFQKRWVAAFNIAVTNQITGLFAGWLPGFGILTHVGRKSGKVYRTPINVFRVSNGFIIALTYSSQSEWVKNVLAAGGCELKTRGVQYELSSPNVVRDPTRRRFPIPVRLVLSCFGRWHAASSINGFISDSLSRPASTTPHRQTSLAPCKFLPIG